MDLGQWANRPSFPFLETSQSCMFCFIFLRGCAAESTFIVLLKNICKCPLCTVTTNILTIPDHYYSYLLCCIFLLLEIVFFSWSSSSRRLPFRVETIFPDIPEKLLTMVLDTLWNGFSPQTDVHTIETDPSAPENNGNICVLVSLHSSLALCWDFFCNFARLIWTLVHWGSRDLVSSAY